MELQPSSVPATAKQEGGIYSRWDWVQPAVWSERMLTALEKGVQGGSWFSLIDKVYSDANLMVAAAKVVTNRGAAGVDHVTVEGFSDQLDANLKVLHRQLKADTFRPQLIRRVHIPKPGTTQTRPLGIPTVRDRVVQTALVHVLEPIYERDFAQQSYGFRPKRGSKPALDRVEELLAAGYCYVVDADLKSYFDTIPQDRLLQRVGEKVSDSRVLSLIRSFLEVGILEGASEWTPTAGAPQGAVLSPLLANIYLDPLDHEMARRGWEMVRYADDFVIFCRSRQQAEAALAYVRAWVAENGLTLHPEKTHLVDARSEAFEFLGFRFQGDLRTPRAKSLEKLKDRIREKTRRTSGRSLQVIVNDVNRTLRGWYGYFWRSFWSVFTGLDGWVRRRLRSILRKRQGRKGISRKGADEQVRWPVNYFKELGLYSMKEAHEKRQSSMR